MSDVQTLAQHARPHEFPHLPFGLQSRPTVCAPLEIAVVIGVAFPALLHGLQSLVMATPGLRLVGACTRPDAFLQCCEDVRDGVAVLDPSLSESGLRRLILAMKAAAPRVEAVLITGTRQAQVVRDAVEVGVKGFVAQDADMQEICDAIQSVAHGQRHFSATVAAHLAESMSVENLTPRETQVLSLLSRGECNKRIARDLDVTVGTVKTHVAAIMLKLGSRSRTEAVLRAGQLGLVHFA